jgi:Fungal N-terminal domain of STAND proteins
MAEPFSIISLLLTTIKTISSTKAFVETIYRAPCSIESLSDELSAIEGLLRKLSLIANTDNEQEMHQILAEPVADCEKVSMELRKLIKPYIKTGAGGTTVWGRFAFGFKESKVLLLHGKLGACKQTLTVAITSANL